MRQHIKAAHAAGAAGAVALGVGFFAEADTHHGQAVAVIIAALTVAAMTLSGVARYRRAKR